MMAMWRDEIKKRWGKVTPAPWWQEINEQGQRMIAATDDRYVAEVGNIGDWEALTRAPHDIAVLFAECETAQTRDAAIRAEYAPLVEAVDHLRATWDALGACVDEFEPFDMRACGERRDHLDDAILRVLVRGAAFEGQVTSGEGDAMTDPLTLTSAENQWCADHADVPDSTEKAIRYMGWFWRDCGPDSASITIGREGGFTAFMQSNKWGYPSRYLTADEVVRLRALVQAGMAGEPDTEDKVNLFLSEMGRTGDWP